MISFQPDDCALCQDPAAGTRQFCVAASFAQQFFARTAHEALGCDVDAGVTQITVNCDHSVRQVLKNSDRTLPGHRAAVCNEVMARLLGRQAQRGNSLRAGMLIVNIPELRGATIIRVLEL
jgi:hypothetical protein